MLVAEVVLGERLSRITQIGQCSQRHLAFGFLAGVLLHAHSAVHVSNDWRETAVRGALCSTGQRSVHPCRRNGVSQLDHLVRDLEIARSKDGDQRIKIARS